MNTNTLIFGVAALFFVALITAAIVEKTPHEKRMEIIEERRALYDLEKKIEFDKAARSSEAFADSLRAEISKMEADSILRGLKKE
jgi:hypothetical protein